MRSMDTKGERPKNQDSRFKIRLPGFSSDAEVGLGDVIKRVTYTMGLQSCGECDRRAAAMNRWLVFTGKRAK
jgi:hypothetical protein